MVTTKRGSFPKVKMDKLLKAGKKRVQWQVLCGDRGHWRVGLYAPKYGKAAQIEKFERHSCPEFFILLSGRVSLALKDRRGKIKTMVLKPGRPVLVEGWHCGFCPDGPYTGTALVVERDSFFTWYSEPKGRAI